MKCIASIIFAALFFAACSSKKTVDLIVFNGQVYTVDSAFSTVAAFAVKNGEIVATGSNDDILKNYTAPDTVNAGGLAVYPALMMHIRISSTMANLYTKSICSIAKAWTR
jgi:predicted amidohydrolase YtcJ